MQEVYDKEGLHEALKKLEAVTGNLGITTIDAALRWAYCHSLLEDHDGIILGASSIEQLRSNVESIKRGPLPEECLRTFDEIWKELEQSRGKII